MCSRIICLLGALALPTACKSTPLDVVYAAGDGVAADAGAAGAGGAGAGGVAAGGAAAGGAAAGGAAAGGAAAGAGPCSLVGPGEYVLRLRDSGLCLGQGAPTTVFLNPGYLLNFSPVCRTAERFWLLAATATPNVFSLQNVSSGYMLDVQMAAIRDGTPVITYGETGFDNQRFEVRARDAFASELRPQHRPSSCVSASLDSAQITACDPNDSTQAWLLLRSSCL